MYLFQRFDWPVARQVEENELLQIELISRNRLFPDKIIGFYGLILQRVVKDGRVNVFDNLIDANHKPLPVIKPYRFLCQFYEKKCL